MDGTDLFRKSNEAAAVPLDIRRAVVRIGTADILCGVDLAVRRSEILAIIGRSGGGKSVLMRAVVGLQPLDAGEIRLFGQPLAAATDSERQALRRRCGVLFQNNALFSSLTIRENVEVPLRENAHLPYQLQEEIAPMKIWLAGLPPEAVDLYPGVLSGGMRKRAAIARAIALDPELLLLDEPTSGLDPPTASEIDALIRTLSRALGLTAVLVTHDLDSVYAIADRVAVLVDGRIIATGPVADVEQIDHPWIQAYFHGPRRRTRQGDGG